MNTMTIKGIWNIIKGRFKQKWARLTDDDLEFTEGKEDELVGRIHKRAGESRGHVEEKTEESCCSCCSRHHQNALDVSVHGAHQ